MSDKDLLQNLKPEASNQLRELASNWYFCNPETKGVLLNAAETIDRLHARCVRLENILDIQEADSCNEAFRTTDGE